MAKLVFTLFAIAMINSKTATTQSTLSSSAAATVASTVSHLKTALNVTQKLENNAENRTSEITPIYSEGGIIPGKGLHFNPEDNIVVNSTNVLASNLPSLDTNVFGSETSVKSPIHGRKGVQYPKENLTDNSEQTDKKHKNSSSATLETKNETRALAPALAQPLPVSSTEKPKKIVIETPKPLPKKPTLTVSSNDADYEGELKRSGLPIKSSMTAASGHPDLVVPVVITVFALPLFAILGYYALKHGREAWKNRHYKRMDFLLDGMYND